MRQAVNFYLEEFKPKRELLSLDHMIAVWFLSLVIGVVLYVFEAEQLRVIEKNKNLALQQQAHQQRQLGELQANFSKRGDVTIMQKELADLDERHQRLEAVLNQLGIRSTRMQGGVAGIMTSLSELQLKRLWLTEITIYQGQLSLVGQTRDAQQIPLLIEQLQQLEGLSDRRFARLQVRSDEHKELHEFSLQSLDFVAPEVIQRGGE